jgi:phosphatidylserine/phosphatidylglycerophosphate/cardiolipin synthase-like enzyme
MPLLSARPLGILVALGALLASAPGCAGDDEDGVGQSESDETEATATLEIHALDLWAQPLPDRGFDLQVEIGGKKVDASPDGAVLRVPLRAAERLVIALGAEDHHDLKVELQFDGSRDERGLSVKRDDDDALAGVTLAHDRGEDGRPVHKLYLGLRHRWFSAEGRPARRGNRVDLLMDGEEAWKSVHADLTSARDEVLVSTWWWQSEFELVRPEGHTTMTAEQRQRNTILGVLEASPATKRVLVGELWRQDGAASGFTTDDGLDAHTRGGDGFEVMGQANPTSGKFTFSIPSFTFADRVVERVEGAEGSKIDDEPEIPSTVAARLVDMTQWPVEVDVNHASWHQKFMVVDHDVAYVGGMNLRTVDWDTSAHAVFDARRMAFDASAAARAEVEAHEELPDNGPRKDYMTRIDGPAAQDVTDVFARRWDLAREQGVEDSETTSAMEIDREQAAHDDGIQVQVTATMPEPIGEHAILESWLNAIGEAEQYVFIEDQYFRAPILNEALMARMQERPELRLVVITKPVNEWTDPGCRWTYESAGLFASSFPGRFSFLQLRSFATQDVLGFDETDAHFVDIDVHSKMLIVDDRFLSVGSCNKNNRGVIYEGELNLAVLDDAWVTAARRRILANILPPGTDVADDAAGWVAQLGNAATANDAVHAQWEAEGMDLDLDGASLPAGYTPSGLVYTLPFGSVDDCLLESVGPDMTLY